jgi:hypothetical protein
MTEKKSLGLRSEPWQDITGVILHHKGQKTGTCWFF